MKRIRIPRPLLGAALCLGLLGLAPAPAIASSPLPAPTRLQALHVSDTAADLSWNSDGATSGDVVEREANGVWSQYASGLFGWLSLTNLTPGTTYTFRVYSIPYDGLGYTTSAPSAPVSFTTLSGPDTVPPSQPPAPFFSSITTNKANVSWGQSTDNVQVTGYHLQQLVGGAWTTIRTVGADATFQGVGGLSAATSYSFAVIAFDARGNTSARSNPGTFTTLANTAAPTCQVSVLAYNPGFQVWVTMTNTTTSTVNGWTIRFTLPATAAVSSVFNSVLTRSGAAGALTPASYNAVIGVGNQAFAGFAGTASPFTPPSGFTLNGQPCSSQ